MPLRSWYNVGKKTFMPRLCRPTLEQVEQAVKFKFSRPENSTLEQVAQAVKFKVLVQN